jgi:hypothetical protein
MSYFSNFTVIPYDIAGDGIYDNITNLTTLVSVSSAALDNISYYDTMLITDGERPEQLSQRLYGTPTYYWTFMLINPKIKNMWNDWPKNENQLLEYSVKKYSDLAVLACNTTDDLVGLFRPVDAEGNEIKEFVIGDASGAVGKIMAVHTNNKYLTIELISGAFKADGEVIRGQTSGNLINASSIVSRAYAPAYHVDEFTGKITNPRVHGTYPVTNIEHETYQNDNHRRIRVVKPEIIDKFIIEFNRKITG